MLINRSTNAVEHSMCAQLPDIINDVQFLSPNGEKPLLVFNDTKVRKARLRAFPLNGTKNETEFLLIETISNENASRTWKALVKKSRQQKPGSVFLFYNKSDMIAAKATVKGREGDCLILDFDRVIDDNWLDTYGHIPLPPYIKRKDEWPDDSERYQTIYAQETGSTAAPTAGLHFTREILDRIAAYGIQSAFITLHIGLGTFLPVRSENVEDHKMHEEQFIITEENAKLIENAIAARRKIIAVGTTSLRTLESAYENGKIKRGWQKTSIFIYPGYQFKAVDALFTNFHTPQSTLLMLVSAFAGRENILSAYQEAINLNYKFFSYGDATLIYIKHQKPPSTRSLTDNEQKLRLPRELSG